MTRDPKTPLTDALYRYAASIASPPDALLAGLREETQQLPNHGMQIAPEQGTLLEMLTRLSGGSLAIEVGTFTGYSSICIARGLRAETDAPGRLICCDISDEYTFIARRYWQRAGLADRITLKLGPASDSLDVLLADATIRGHVDLMFVDADKAGYLGYLDQGLQLLRPGGVIVFDNTLWHGQIIDHTDQRPDTVSLRTLNQRLRDDQSVVTTLLPIGDGLTAAVKRP